MSGKALGLSTVLALVCLLALTAVAATQTVADDFSSGGYSGSTGTSPWIGDWVEIGESNGPDTGSVRVRNDSRCAVDPCLTITAVIGGLPVGASRQVDLTKSTAASFSYHVDFPGGLLVGGQILSQARVGTGSWKTLNAHGPGAEGEFTADLPSGGVVTVQFVTSGFSLVPSGAIDDVEIIVNSPDPTTTSSSTTTSTSTTMLPPLTLPTIPTSTSTSTSTTTSTSTSTTTTTTTIVTSTSPGGPRPGSAGDGSTDPNNPAPIIEPAIPPSRNQGVVTDLVPRLGSANGGLSVGAQTDLLVGFSTDVEDISLDLMASTALGFLFAVMWSRRLESDSDEEPEAQSHAT